ncbi:hypothetical protein [Streptacidiphilus jiangxiensis]|uniref:Heparin binding hemagglutinin HbhA n=1 Tax=Streptacidiphilus jiangxiensis TaxID=235985 RepID=A0A1H7Y166_STRJI|nr:hypothetical protein [Streptacidiphilus jiangxiensis]SEM39902.1 hypothetical protein SAMN05414137_12656 [Streptacidiphilus jiangxiensis]
MAIAEDLRKTLSDPTPLYALAGAGDLAVEKLKTVPERAAALAADRKAAQDKAAAKLGEAQTRLNEAQVKVSEAVQTLPTDLKSLQEKAQGLALQSVGRAAELAVKAREAYDELAARGKAVVDRQFNGAETLDGEPAIEAPAAPVAKADVFAAETEEPKDAAPAAEADAEAPAPKPARKAAPRKPRANG